MNEFDKWLTLGMVALRLGVLEGQLRRMCRRGEIPHKLFHGSRVFDVADLDTIRAACVRRGYLKPEVTADAAR